MSIAVSVNKIPIRLTEERWQHITIGHPEIAAFYYEILDCIELPDAIYEGKFDELIATKNFDKISNKFVVVVYKELSVQDGFVITAYLSNKVNEFIKRNKIWDSQK
jgi:hypothetical protein